MLLSPEEIKSQLRLDEDYADEDKFLELLGRAVQARTENFLNRRLYTAETGVPADDPEGLIVYGKPPARLGVPESFQL
ncbi:head-tail connector protein [Salmonella enterica]|uniref:head-tail connector protein n=1 Tax=Salmonella enterica TaxID=28901 RepID=UPI003B42F12E